LGCWVSRGIEGRGKESIIVIRFAMRSGSWSLPPRPAYDTTLQAFL
jgi:hypothetical protein